jgi:NTP pyrophosphatase (non-canonical NTP hydrolase)
MMDISQYQKEVDNWIRTTGVRYFSELTNTAILTEEVGEVARLMARIYGDQSFRQPMEEADQKAALADELADVLWVVACLANQTGIDLEQALQENINKKTKRDTNRHINNPKLK